jgi:protein LTV1
VNEAPDENAIYNVASKTVNVRVQKAVDPEVSALLDDSDASRFGSDVEDLEEDFVVKANLPDEDEEEDVCIGDGPNFGAQFENKNASNEVDVVRKNCVEREEGDFVVDDPRARRDVDEEFDMVSVFSLFSINYVFYLSSTV